MKNDLVTIQQVTETRSSNGAITESWDTFCEVWADVEQVSGSEGLNADMIVYNDVKSFVVYYNQGQLITAKMRILYRDEIYKITSISHKNRLDTTLIAIRHDDE